MPTFRTMGAMGTVFVTGMSGAGKSTVLRELHRQGVETVDTDYGSWCHDVDGDYVWDEPLHPHGGATAAANINP